MTVTTIQAGRPQTTWRNPRDYVPAPVWDREIQLLVRDNPFDTVMAERLFGQGIAYLITAMEKHGQGLELGCGELVDTAVHALILDTANYRSFCDEHFGGKFLDHIPEIDRKYDGTVERTSGIVAANGFPV